MYVELHIQANFIQKWEVTTNFIYTSLLSNAIKIHSVVHKLLQVDRYGNQPMTHIYTFLGMAQSAI
jgi:hypothetical protein